MEQAFNINNRFVVYPSLNTVTDKQKREETRIEPRLMSLLMILSENVGQVVPREKVVTEIWNDYGGADEGLNQAISVLRKILDDRDKKLIETVPKKGYVLNASISLEKISRPEQKGTVLIEKKSRKVSYAIPLLVIFFITLWLIFRNRSEKSVSPDVLKKEQDTSSARNQPPANPDIRNDLKKESDSMSVERK